MGQQELTELEFQQTLALVKDTYHPWWNRSWIPSGEHAMLVSLTIFFCSDKESGGLVPYDQGGAIPSLNTWKEINQAVEQFYASCDSDTIDETNWFELVHKHLPRDKPSRRVSKTGCVYLLEGDNCYKIGLSKDAAKRTNYLSVKLPFETKLVCIINSEDMYSLESQLHKRFESKRINGEWFNLNGEDVEYIKGLADEVFP